MNSQSRSGFVIVYVSVHFSIVGPNKWTVLQNDLKYIKKLNKILRLHSLVYWYDRDKMHITVLVYEMLGHYENGISQCCNPTAHRTAPHSCIGERHMSHSQDV